MADYTYDGPAVEQAPEGQSLPAGRKLATMTNWAGAAVSLALIAGVGVWGYKLVMRDVTGIPVVRAMEGPMRIAPEDPGGTRADNQGLAVNDVAGTGVAAPVPDRLLLAPSGLGLSDEDVPEARLQTAQRNSDRVGPAVLTPGAVPPALGEGATGESDAGDPIQALADQIAAGAAPLTPLVPADDEETGDALTEDTDSGLPDETAPEGALIRSLRPHTRPEALRANTQIAAALAPVTETEETTSEIDPGSLPAGTRLAQLGAYDSPETARKEWERFSTRFGEFMEGKDRVIERATSGGRVFYRLRAAGFADLSDARRFCAAFVAENADCIPVTTR